MPPEPPTPIRFDDFEIDPHSLELRRGGTRVDLSPQGVRLLAFLVERRGDLVTREALYDFLWPQGEVDMDRDSTPSSARCGSRSATPRRSRGSCVPIPVAAIASFRRRPPRQCRHRPRNFPRVRWSPRAGGGG